MLNSAVIDVGIAIVYVFVLVSILVSALNEIIAGLLKQRAKALWHGIGDLLKSKALRDQFYQHGLIRSLGPPVSGALLTPERMAGPSYIPKETFVVTLLDLLKQLHSRIKEVESALNDTRKTLESGQPPFQALATVLLAQAAKMPAGTAIRHDLTKLAAAMTAAGPETAQILPLIDALQKSLPTSLEEAATLYSKDLGTVVRVLVEEAAGNIERFRKSLEEWFDTGMDRVAGWYKRWTQVWQLCIGLVLAVVLNINVVAIGQRLWDDIPLRTAIVAEAEKFAKEPPAGLPVKSATKSEGDLELRATAVGLRKDDKRVLVNVKLRENAKEDTTVTVKAPDVTFEKASLVIPKGRDEAEFAGMAKAFPLSTTLDASATAGPEGKPTTRTARLAVTLDANPATQIDRTREQLSKTQLPIGWPEGFPFTTSFNPKGFDSTQIAGWLLTAIDASFGAPFWFDLLGRITKLRSGGPKPDEPKPGAKPTGSALA